MTRVMSSMAEIVRVGGWALRGLGYPFGIAERGVPLLAWTEAATGGAIGSLRQAEAEIARSHAAPRLTRMAQSDGGRRLEAHGRHLVEIGPPVVDLATADARRDGMAELALSGSIGSGFAPALAGILAHRNLCGALLLGSGAGGPGGTAWLPFRPGFVAAPMPIDAGGAAWEAWLRSAAPAEASRIRQALDRQLAEIGGAPGSRLAVIAWRPDAASDGVPGENLAARVAEAWRCGVETADEDLRYLYALEVRTWAPTSERSRAQAGFGKY